MNCDYMNCNCINCIHLKLQLCQLVKYLQNINLRLNKDFCLNLQNFFIQSYRHKDKFIITTMQPDKPYDKNKQNEKRIIKNEPFSQNLHIELQISEKRQTPKFSRLNHKRSQQNLPQQNGLSRNVQKNGQMRKYNDNKKLIQSQQKETKAKQTLKSLNINIKSNTKELISSRQYKNRMQETEWSSPSSSQNDKYKLVSGISWQQSVKESENQAQNRSTKGQFAIKLLTPKLFSYQINSQDDQQFHKTVSSAGSHFNRSLTPGQLDMAKLSQTLTEMMLKNDAKRIQKLNDTNQQLKSISKEIIALLRNDSKNIKRKAQDQLTIKQIYGIISNYDLRNK